MALSTDSIRPLTSSPVGLSKPFLKPELSSSPIAQSGRWAPRLRKRRSKVEFREAFHATIHDVHEFIFRAPVNVCKYPRAKLNQSPQCVAGVSGIIKTNREWLCSWFATGGSRTGRASVLPMLTRIGQSRPTRSFYWHRLPNNLPRWPSWSSRNVESCNSPIPSPSIVPVSRLRPDDHHSQSVESHRRPHGVP